MTAPLILALETSCDETAAAVCDGTGRILAGVVSSQIPEHEPYGGVVPEVASRNHMLRVRPLISETLAQAGVPLDQIGAFAATSGPGLASSLLIGNTVAKSLALACGRPFIPVNHLEGHLLSPFIGLPSGVVPGIGLIVSGGHTLLLHVRGPGDYVKIGSTLDDAAGEAFDKGARMMGLPYPGGPHIDRLARLGDPVAFAFPRSMIDSGNFAFSFSGLKTSLYYLLQSMTAAEIAERTPDLCASYQEAIVDVLVSKSIRAARQYGQTSIGLSGGVSCNSRIRSVFTEQCRRAGLRLCMAEPALTTDNAAMIAWAALQRLRLGVTGSLTEDIDPNLALVSVLPPPEVAGP